MPLLEQGAIPFIDREQTLESLLEFTAQPEGRCHVVVGRRGIGKSRVLRRFVKLVETKPIPPPQRICVLHEPSPLSPPLLSYIRLEKQLADHPEIRRITETPGLDPWVPALTAWLQKMVATSDPAAAPAVGTLSVDALALRLLRTDGTHSPYDVVEHFLQTLLFFSRSLDSDQRLVLVFDPRDELDSMASDASRVHVLQHIVQNLPDKILVLLALQRSDPTSEFGGLLQQSNVISFEDLEPFGAKDVHELLKKVFDREVPFTDAHRVCRRYGGDPAMLELAVEYVRRQAQDPIRRLAEEVPANLFQLIRLLYEDLDDSPLEQLLLRSLAVALEPVPLDFVLKVADADEPLAVVERALSRPEARNPAERLIRGAREHYQIRQLVWIEFLQNKARTLGELENFNSRAGTFYESRNQPFLALAHYARARDLDGIRRNLAVGLEWHQLHGETLRVQELHRRLSDLPLENRERFLLNRAYAWAWSQRGEAQEVLNQVEGLLSECEEDSVERAELLILRGDAYHNSSRYEEAYHDFCEARNLLERLGLEGSMPHRRAWLEAVHIEIHLGDFISSEAAHYEIWQRQRLLTDSEDRRTQFQSARELRRYGELLVFTGDWKNARDYLTSALELFRDLEDRKGQGHTLRRLADLNVLAGDKRSLRRAIREAEQAKDLLTDLKNRGAGWMDLVLGEAHRGLGQLDEAREAHRRAWVRYESGESPHLMSMAELGLAECERPSGTPVEMEPYERAVRRYERLRFRWGIGTALIYRALGHLSADREAAGLEDLERAGEIFSSMELRPPLEAIRRIRDDRDLGFHPIIVL